MTGAGSPAGNVKQTLSGLEALLSWRSQRLSWRRTDAGFHTQRVKFGFFSWRLSDLFLKNCILHIYSFAKGETRTGKSKLGCADAFILVGPFDLWIISVRKGLVGCGFPFKKDSCNDSNRKQPFHINPDIYMPKWIPRQRLMRIRRSSIFVHITCQFCTRIGTFVLRLSAVLHFVHFTCQFYTWIETFHLHFPV